MPKNFILNFLLIYLLSLLVACDPKNKTLNFEQNTQIISTCFANKLGITTIDSIEQIKGGASGAQLFKVYASGKIYIVRIIKNRTPQQINREIICQEIASKQGYGPTIYATDVDQGIIVMDFLEREPITVELRNTEKFHTTMGTFLRTMHTGPSFPLIEKNNYKEIEIILEKLEHNAQSIVTIQRIRNIMHDIRSATQHFPHLAPCHNDLNPENLFYAHGKALAIDFESARQDDPYFDIATVSVYNCFNIKNENILLNAYFQGPMSAQEKSKYYLIKQLVSILIALHFIRSNNLKSDVIAPNTIAHAQPFAEIIEMIIQGIMNVEIGHEQERFLLAQSMLKEAFINTESQEFKSAIEYLTTQKK